MASLVKCEGCEANSEFEDFLNLGTSKLVGTTVIKYRYIICTAVHCRVQTFILQMSSKDEWLLFGKSGRMHSHFF